MFLAFHEKQPFHGKPSPWVIRLTMSSPDVVPMSEDSQGRKITLEASVCLVLFLFQESFE